MQYKIVIVIWAVYNMEDIPTVESINVRIYLFRYNLMNIDQTNVNRAPVIIICS